MMTREQLRLFQNSVKAFERIAKSLENLEVTQKLISETLTDLIVKVITV